MIKENDRVLLIGEKREFFVRAGEGDLSTDKGIIKLADLTGLDTGDIVKTHLGVSFKIRIPRPVDFFSYAKRTGAPMLPKDIGTVIAYTGMNKKDRVLDAGTGSGVAAIFFGSVAGFVDTYEIREEFSKICAKNIADAGLENVRVNAGDFLSVESDEKYDVIHLDMQIEKEHVKHAYGLLKTGGYLATYTPFLEQTFNVMDAAEDLFSEVVCHELIGRELSRTKRGTRPSTRVCHTGYITICRK
ncbi:methyltransferase domain-containing protein [Methanoplanus sp. FWC-SCC4]|uniref:Methyltransferase domain-containing protein n=1 Tax=Methanochimaera problematica TaxID=2609417 RepID=A0AA97FDV2_9EURY|nr:methyltransferase domain-containing protein [Methanoplanus sp. FWC-SCC4]WOF16414.1 methyltransferase domain-containing protein [Methanoplanus sp. FWC-SCC4]